MNPPTDGEPTAKTVNVTLSRQDFSRFARFIVWRKNRATSLLMILLYLFIGFSIGALLLDQGFQFMTLLRSEIVWLSMLGTGAVALLLREVQIRRLVALNQSHQLAGGGPTMTVRVDDNGITTLDELEKLEVKWNAVREVIPTATDLYVGIGPHRYIIIPRSAFHRPGQDLEFQQALERRRVGVRAEEPYTSATRVGGTTPP